MPLRRKMEYFFHTSKSDGAKAPPLAKSARVERQRENATPQESGKMPTVVDKKDRAGALSFALILCDNLTRGGRAALPHERGMKSTVGR